ncbi:MAG: hypothetical protein B1H11_12600, partial [Desulfobacteraceae bacterium 4484_190.1]
LRDSLPALFAQTEFLVMPDPANEEIYFIQFPVLSFDELAECQRGDLPIGMVEIIDQTVRREKIPVGLLACNETGEGLNFQETHLKIFIASGLIHPSNPTIIIRPGHHSHFVNIVVRYLF